MSANLSERAAPRGALRSWFQGVKLSSCLLALLGSAILAFGLYNVHAVSHVTEGGVLGLTLLLEHWFGISPSISGFVLNGLCYLLGWRMLGKRFVVYSIVSTVGFSAFYGIFEQFDPLFPQIADMPLTAAVVGALFVGFSAGLCVRIGGAPTGDDALAMSISKVSHVDIQWVYLLSDLTVLAMSLSYISLERIAYSLLTVILSGQLIGVMQKLRLPGSRGQAAPAES